MKRIIIGLIVVSAALSFSPASVHAISSSIRRGEVIENENKISTTPGQVRKEVKKDNISGKPGETGIINRVKNFIKKNFKFGARIQGTILSIGTSNLSEKGNDGKTYQVNISATTKLIRGFGGKSNLTEFSVGDKIMVFGKFTDSSQTTINANTIRNLSIQKRRGAFFGKVTSHNTDNFVMETLERGTQMVYFGTAKFVNRKEVNIFYSDVKVGDRVRVKGVWDKTLNKINEVTQIKDFSLPVIAPTPTGSI